MKMLPALLALFLVTQTVQAFARHDSQYDQPKTGSGLTNATVLIIRHAEKPENGSGLAPEGERRAQAYVSYFQKFSLDGAAVRIDALIASADSKASRRPRLTLEPFSQATGIRIQQPFKDRDVDGLVKWLRQSAPNRSILIAWHHGRLPKLLSALGADPTAILPGGKWPSDIYDWVVVLKYDRSGDVLSGFPRLIREPIFLQ